MSLVVLAAYAVLILRWPLVGIGLGLTLVNPGSLAVGDTTVRVLLIPVQLFAVAWHALRRGGTPDERWKRPLRNPGLLAVLFIIAWLSVSWELLSVFDLRAVKLFVLFAVIPVGTVAVLVRNEKDLRVFVAAVATGAMAQGIFELPQFLSSVRAEGDEVVRLGMSTVGTSRMLISGWWAWATIVFAGWAIESKSGKRKAAALAGGSAAIVLALAAGTRSSLAGLVAAVAYLLWRRGHRLAFGGLAVGLGIVLLFAPSFRTAPALARLADFVENPAGESESRMTLYRKALFTDWPVSPWLGTGAFVSGDELPVINWDRNIGAIETGDYYRQNYENVYLTVLVENGVIGLAAFVWCMWSAWRAGGRGRESRVNLSSLGVVLRALWIAAAVRNLFGGTLIGALDLLVTTALLGAYGAVLATTARSRSRAPFQPAGVRRLPAGGRFRVLARSGERDDAGIPGDRKWQILRKHSPAGLDPVQGGSAIG